MKHFVAPEHLNHFRKHQIIELEGLFTSEQSVQLFQKVEQTLLERLKIPPHLLETLSPYKKFLAGRDLWRNDMAIRKTVTNHNFLETVATLTDQSILRMGYDQYIPTMASDSQKLDENYTGLFNRQCTVEMISCLQGIVAGAIILLKGEPQLTEQTEQAEQAEPVDQSILPSKPGNVVIFGAQADLDFSQLLKSYNQEYLLVTFTERKSVYVYREADPNTHFLKNLGYNLSDRLNDRLHPIVYRRS